MIKKVGLQPRTNCNGVCIKMKEEETKKMKEEETKFIDAESYIGGGDKERLTFREIVLLQVKQIGQNANCEFRGGYWQENTKQVGGMAFTNKIWISDSREIYSNSIEYLFDLLADHFDKGMIKAGEKAEKDIQGVYEDHTVINEPEREDEDEEESKSYRTFKDKSNKLSFRSERRKINRILFRELCRFLKRKNYFKGRSFEEEV